MMQGREPGPEPLPGAPCHRRGGPHLLLWFRGRSPVHPHQAAHHFSGIRQSGNVSYSDPHRNCLLSLLDPDPRIVDSLDIDKIITLFFRCEQGKSLYFEVQPSGSALIILHVTNKQCCRSGIRCYFDPGIRNEWKIRIRDPHPGLTTRIKFPRAEKQFLGLKYFNSLMRIRDPGWKKFESGMNIPDPKHQK